MRFGKFLVMKSTDKKIEIIVNGQKTGMEMTLGNAGEAYFLTEAPF